jgi:hypothetical protein
MTGVTLAMMGIILVLLEYRSRLPWSRPMKALAETREQSRTGALQLPT